MFWIVLGCIATLCVGVAFLYWLIGALPKKRTERNDANPHDMFYNPVRDDLRDIKSKLGLWAKKKTSFAKGAKAALNHVAKRKRMTPKDAREILAKNTHSNVCFNCNATKARYAHVCTLCWEQFYDQLQLDKYSTATELRRIDDEIPILIAKALISKQLERAIDDAWRSN